jgi:hypothetical protein
MKGKIDRWISVLIIANFVIVAILLTAALADWLKLVPTGQAAQPEASASASPPDLMPMGLAHIPTSASCLLCHLTGGEAGLKPVPALGHPLEGWRQCVVCHTDDRLGRTAPGHVGIQEKECLNCHKVAPPGPAITQPHSRLQDQQCLDCHGSVAHLPTSMVGRRQDECWLCHKPTALPPPKYPHGTDARLSCRSCHRSAEVGNLPIDHALRGDSTCLLCHDIKQVPTAPPTGA